MSWYITYHYIINQLNIACVVHFTDWSNDFPLSRVVILDPVLIVHVHLSHPASSHLPCIFNPFHIFHFPATLPPLPVQLGETEAERAHDAGVTRWGEGRGRSRAQGVPVSRTFPQVEVCYCWKAQRWREAWPAAWSHSSSVSYLPSLPKMFGIPVGFIDLSEQTVESKLCLVRCAFTVTGFWSRNV